MLSAIAGLAVLFFVVIFVGGKSYEVGFKNGIEFSEWVYEVCAEGQQEDPQPNPIPEPTPEPKSEPKPKPKPSFDFDFDRSCDFSGVRRKE